MGKIFGIIMLGSLPALAGAADFGSALWLSEAPPPKQKAAIAEKHDHTEHERHAVQAAVQASAPPSATTKKHDHDSQIVLDESPGKDHKPGKQVWLRKGDEIASARYVAAAKESEQLTIINLQGENKEITASHDSGRLTFTTELPEIGFYDVYLEQRAVRNGTLEVQLPKIELLWASCSAKEVDEEAVAKPIINPASPLELVREHSPDEGCMARIVSGDIVNFRVLNFGKPAAGIPVTMVTQEGWRKTRVSDKNGQASFTMIREYYPKWLEFKKYHTDTFLVIAEQNSEESGELGGQRYSSTRYMATLPGKYRPSPHDYRSYAWGLGIALFVIIFGGLAVYLYRRRRLKPYREERLDDKT